MPQKPVGVGSRSQHNETFSLKYVSSQSGMAQLVMPELSEGMYIFGTFAFEIEEFTRTANGSQHVLALSV